MRTVGVLLLVALTTLAGCYGGLKHNNLPPSPMLAHPGPGVDGPGPGVIAPIQPAGPVVPAVSQIYFVGPEGINVSWDVSAPGAFDSEPRVAPARYNFPQGAIYRLKLSNIPGRPGIELYPTLEVGPALPRTEAFLAHNAIPVQFTEEDFDQVLTGNFVTKVIYLPDPEFQELALAGVETLVSTRLDPGVDPIIEADHRGAIMAIVRLGNKDLGVPGSNGTAGEMNPGMAPGMPGGACPTPMPNGYIAGMTAPQYGMPMVGTPIGLPGPPHVPLGVPAGLQRHSIVNHTRTNIPEPTQHVRIDVKQSPGYSYPRPANWALVHERTTAGVGTFRQPLGDRVENVKGGQACPAGASPTGECPTNGDPGASGTPAAPCASGSDAAN